MPSVIDLRNFWLQFVALCVLAAVVALVKGSPVSQGEAKVSKTQADSAVAADAGDLETAETG